MNELVDVSDEFEVSSIFIGPGGGIVVYLALVHRTCGKENHVMAIKDLTFTCEGCNKKYRLLSVIPLRVGEVK